MQYNVGFSIFSAINGIIFNFLEQSSSMTQRYKVNFCSTVHDKAVCAFQRGIPCGASGKARPKWNPALFLKNPPSFHQVHSQLAISSHFKICSTVTSHTEETTQRQEKLVNFTQRVNQFLRYSW